MRQLERDIFGIFTPHGEPGPHLMGANTLTGNNVFDHKNEEVGDIKELMLDLADGKVAYAVLSFGGARGGSEKLFTVPWSALSLDTENRRFVLKVDKDELPKAPGFDNDDWPDMTNSKWMTDLHAYYGTDAHSLR
ncbi:MAG: PRC-barrel domain-containing protein [Pseudomonadota bacterium]